MEFLADCRARMALDLLADTPPRVEYALTPLGEWADRHGDAVTAAQERAS